jgi:hypothetical protein
MASARTTHPETTLPARLAAGVAGGLAGGVVFGVLMQMMDMMPMVAMLIDSGSVAVGWLVHLVIAAVLGGVFGLVAAPWLGGLATAGAVGLVYGLVWWVLGALAIMPARLGMDLFVLNTTAWQSLTGHLVYGLLLGGVAALVAGRMRPAA